MGGPDRGVESLYPFLYSATSDVDAVLEQVEFPLEHHAEVMGGFDERQADQARFIGIAVIAAITVFLLLQAAFRSWRLAAMSFSTLPLAVAGGGVAALLTGGTLTLGSIAGLVAVVGFAARAVILLIRRFQKLEHDEGMAFGPELVVRGTRQSMAPTVVAALATAIVLAPIRPHLTVMLLCLSKR